MIKKIKEVLTNAVLVLVATAMPLAAAGGIAGAQATTPSIQEGLETGACLNTSSDTCGTEDPEDAVNTIITTVINIFSLVVGVISVIMIIIGGLKYITSGGDSGNVSGAKNTILYAIIGLVVVALSQVIVRFVLQRVTEA